MTTYALHTACGAGPLLLELLVPVLSLVIETKNRAYRRGGVFVLESTRRVLVGMIVVVHSLLHAAQCAVGDYSFLPLHRAMALVDAGAKKASATGEDLMEARKDEVSHAQLRALAADVAALRGLLVANAAAASVASVKGARRVTVRPPVLEA